MTKKIVLFFVSFSIYTFSQVNYEPIDNKVYDFLENLSIKGVITFNDEIKPLSRKYIADKLVEAINRKENFTHIELDELEFYIKEYYDEIYNRKKTVMPSSSVQGTIDSSYRSDLVRFGRTDRLRLFSYNDKNFTLNIDPILGYTIGGYYGSSYLHRWNGASMFGRVGENLGFELNFRDNLEQGNTIDRDKYLTPTPGVNILKDKSNSIEYSEVRANISYSWNWGVISLGKEYQRWGSGKNGQLILSDKAPSFPMVKLEIKPVDWFSFTYIHGWLHSEIMDSSTFRYGIVQGRDTYSQIPKFIAAHMFSFDLVDNLRISLGESMIYSDKIEPIYLIPVMFFRLGDHYMGAKNANTGSNAQIFANMYYVNKALRAKFYSTLFIDELTIEGLLDGKDRSAIGYTLGTKFVDPFISNSSITIEFTKLQPFVYMNSDPVEQYASHHYQLGHWIGSNGYNCYSCYYQKVFRGLSFSIEGQLVKKGQKELHDQQYSVTPPTLYGAKYYEKTLGIEISYEYIHEMSIKLSCEFSDISDEDPIRTSIYKLGKQTNLGVSIYYGL